MLRMRPPKRRYEPGAQDSHETGQDNQVGIIFLDALGKRMVETVTVREIAVGDHAGRDTAATGPVEAGGIRPVADHGRNAGTKVSPCRSRP